MDFRQWRQYLKYANWEVSEEIAVISTSVRIAVEDDWTRAKSVGKKIDLSSWFQNIRFYDGYFQEKADMLIMSEMGYQCLQLQAFWKYPTPRVLKRGAFMLTPFQSFS